MTRSTIGRIAGRVLLGVYLLASSGVVGIATAMTVAAYYYMITT